MAIDEVSHLEHLVDGADREAVVDFEVAGVVRTVVADPAGSIVT